MDQTVSPRKRASQIFLIILLIIFLVELIVMGAIHVLFIFNNIWLDVFIDAALLALFLYLPLYYLILRPMEREIAERNQSQMELHRAKELLETANQDIKESLEREQLLARTDGLTGLYNYRYFFEIASREFSASLRYQRVFSIIIFDTDHFKQVNDTLGHLAGDKLLVTLAQTLAAQMRGTDVPARYGGDEFVILLPETRALQAFQIAERIRVNVETALREVNQGRFVNTLSMGVAELCTDPVDKNIEQVVQRADQALYQAKQAGRNRTVIFDTALL
jgi:diguanylate cyclase (GGDEF)-like protein